MATLILRYNKYSARVWVPEELRPAYGGKQHLQRALGTGDKSEAKRRAGAWEALMKLEFAESLGEATSSQTASLRETYEAILSAARRDEYQAHTLAATDDACMIDPLCFGPELELDRIAAETHPEEDLAARVQARVDALQDARRERLGGKPQNHRRYEPSFSELSALYLRAWEAEQGSSKQTNTKRQKEATFRLFGSYWRDRPIRAVTEPEAASFYDDLKGLPPNWARSPKGREMTWAELQRHYGGGKGGYLSAATMNRHMAALQALWEWSRRRGDNPFDGFHKRLRKGENVNSYIPWKPDELTDLFNPPPRRDDLKEVMLVALYSGMRINEIATLTWGRIGSRDGITYFRVTEAVAKTPDSVRDVPAHSKLDWLLQRERGEDEDRLWPDFNPEGPGRKPGNDAGRMFTEFKADKGYADRRKTFHSFRKNAAGVLERAGVRDTEIAQLLGHKRSFTSDVYGGGQTLKRLAEVIEHIDYADARLPEISA